VRVLIDEDPFAGRASAGPWQERGRWPASWVGCPDAGDPPFVSAYRLSFAVERAATVRVHVTADERYELFLDGARVGRGSERGTADLWFFETYDLPLAPGPHALVARVWTLGERAPYAQMHVRSGFLLAADGEALDLLGTGVAAWEAKRLDGYAFVSPAQAWGTGWNLDLDGSAFPWGFERGEGDGWRPVTPLQPAAGLLVGYEWPPQHLLLPATLPPMLEEVCPAGTVRLVAAVNEPETAATPVRAADHRPDEAAAWSALLGDHVPLTVPAGTARRVLVDLEAYRCAYPEIVTSGGAGGSVRLHWAEALCHQPKAYCKDKGNRDEIEGKYLVGVGDTFRPDGGAGHRFDTLWWQAGRYLELVVRTADEPLTIERLTLRETRYPLEAEASFAASDPRLAGVIPLLVRGLQLCAHETYMDCPYYEQLQYAGDTRLEALTTYVLTRDARLPRKALHLFDRSRLASGLTQARYPSHLPQVIAPFALWWVAMVRDYAFWRDDPAAVAALMPGVRATVEGFLRFLGPDGLVHAPDGWNYMDWVPSWEPGGIPPDAAAGVSGPVNWQLALILGELADLEARLGEPELSARAGRQAAALADRASAAFWDEGRGLLADDPAHRHFSEHSQCLALLGGRLDPARRDRVAAGLLSDGDLARTTIYFTHYLFETYRQLDRIDALIERMGLWFDLEKVGLKTLPEMPEPTRSDCHAWGAHPLYHYVTSILGIRPAALGFRTVEVAPRLGPLTRAEGRIPHPRGEIAVEVRAEGGEPHGSVTLPPGVDGTLRLGGASRPLVAGRQEF
jgi:hypothetical protein